MTNTRMRLVVAAGLLLAACARGSEDRSTPGDSASARKTDSASGAMAGMDHSNMPGMGTATSGATATSGGTMAGMDHSSMPGTGTSTAQGSTSGSMAGMDHSNMPGMSSATPARSQAGTSRGSTMSGMSGMDHSNMPGMSANPSAGGSRSSTTATGSMAGMDHANMPGMSTVPTSRGQGGTSRGSTASGTGGMAGMDHSTMPMSTGATPGMQGMPGMQAAPDAATQKLQELVATLVEDPAVRQRILADSTLRKGWQNPAVRQSVRKQP